MDVLFLFCVLMFRLLPGVGLLALSSLLLVALCLLAALLLCGTQFLVVCSA